MKITKIHRFHAWFTHEISWQSIQKIQSGAKWWTDISIPQSQSFGVAKTCVHILTKLLPEFEDYQQQDTAQFTLHWCQTEAATHLSCLQRRPQTDSKYVWAVTIWSRGQSACLAIAKSFLTSGHVELLKMLLQEVNAATPHIPLPFQECTDGPFHHLRCPQKELICVYMWAWDKLTHVSATRL